MIPNYQLNDPEHNIINDALFFIFTTFIQIVVCF